MSLVTRYYREVQWAPLSPICKSTQTNKYLIFLNAVMPCPFTGLKMFWARPNFLCQTKNLFTFCGSHKHSVPDKKIWFAFSKIVFCAGTKVFQDVLNTVKFSGWIKKFGPAQNILGTVKGQGISIHKICK